MGNKLNISDEEVAVVLAKIKMAREDATKQSETRTKNQNAYYRLPLLNEKEDRSRIIDTAVANHIGGLHPHLMRRFLATDLKIKIKGPDPKQAKGLKQKIRDDINDQGGFDFIDNVLKDGEICHNGTAKMWWQRVFSDPEDVMILADEKTLSELVDDIRYDFGQEDVRALPVRRAVVNDGMPRPDAPEGSDIEIEGAQMYEVRAKFRELEESGPVLASIPPEQFICERGKSKMNDRFGCGLERPIIVGELQRENERRSMPDEPYYENLREAAAAGNSNAAFSTLDQERRDREALAWIESGLQPAFAPINSEDLRKPGVIDEWCDWATVDGKLVPAYYTFLNDIKIRVEDNEEGIIPYSTWSPTPNPHSIIGQSVAALHVDSQNTRTVITRALLDNIAMTVDKPKWVKNRGTDLMGLRNVTPGKLLFGNPEDIAEFDTAQLDYRMLQVLEYLKAEGEERGPTTRFNQGTDSGPGGNDTATGIKIVQRASFSKIDLIAMCFSELFLVDLYNKLIILYQKNLDMPLEVIVDGETIVLTRKSIEGRYTAHSDLGAEMDYDDRAFQQTNSKLQMMTSMLKEGLYPFAPSAIKEALRDVFIAGGEAEPSKYLEAAAPPPQAPGPGGQPPPPGGAPNVDLQSDKTVSGGAADPGAGMAVGQ